MEPIFTLQWSEFAVAQKIASQFKKSEGFSVLIPLSRTESGIDFVLMKKQSNQKSKSITFQVKSSRTYPQPLRKSRTDKEYLRYISWYNRFKVSPLADYCLLTSHYIETPSNGVIKQKTAEWYQDCTLLLSNVEMSDLIDSCKNKNGDDNKQFGFGFNSREKVVQTRGEQDPQKTDFTAKLLDNRWDLLRKQFD